MSTKEKVLIDELIKIDGIGTKKAKELIAAGLTRKSDLRFVKYKKLLTAESLYALKYNISKNLRWDFASNVIHIFQSVVGRLNIIGVGSYRRKRPFLRDIDLLTTLPLKTILEKIQTYNDKSEDSALLFIGAYSHGDKKLSMILHYNHKYFRTDIFKTTKKEMSFALLHYTGPKEFNIRVRAKAKYKGYKLNQFGLFDSSGSVVELKTEKAILDHLGISYKKPSERDT